MSKVTVLVAAYNADRYLEECLDSLIRQTLRDIQIVIIDDASTDSTHEISERYSQLDSRICLITESENQGLARARNHGIEIADGQYITMVDADDMISDDALERAVMILDNEPDTDTVLFSLAFMYKDRTEPFIMKSGKSRWSGQEAFELSMDWGIHGLYVARDYLFRDYPYDDTCRLYSDENSSRLHFLHSRMVAVCDGVYYYRQHDESLTHALSALRLDLLEANASLARHIKAEGQPRRVLSFFEEKRWINLTGICGFWLEHREILPETEALERFRRIWKDIDRNLLPARLRLKFGYWPCLSFRGYFLQVKIYFLLRRLLGK